MRGERADLAAAHLYLVGHAVRQSGAPAHTWDDLTSAGQYALCLAAERFNPAHGVPFYLFANRRIKGALLDTMRNLDPLSRPQRREVTALNLAEETVGDDTGAVAACLGTSPADVVARRRHRTNTHAASLDSPFTDRRAGDTSGDEFGSLGAALVDPAPDPADALIHAELLAALVQAVRQLPEALQLVIRRSFLQELPMSFIGLQLDVSKSRVSQLRAEALERLRELLSA